MRGSLPGASKEAPDKQVVPSPPWGGDCVWEGPSSTSLREPAQRQDPDTDQDPRPGAFGTGQSRPYLEIIRFLFIWSIVRPFRCSQQHSNRHRMKWELLTPPGEGWWAWVELPSPWFLIGTRLALLISSSLALLQCAWPDTVALQ